MNDNVGVQLGGHAVHACIACGSSALRAVLALGEQPLANNLVAADDPSTEPDRQFPLGIQQCENCQLVQLTHVVDPSLMFSTYRYVPSASTVWLEHCEELADFVCATGRLKAGDFVVEIGSNDGALLRAFQRRGLEVLGVDPASNIAELANAAGVPTLNRFFGLSVAQEIVANYRRADAVVSTNVLAHVPDPLGVLRGVQSLLRPGAIYVNESPWLREMVRHNEFDTIYHEHVSYFSLNALSGLLDRAGLTLVKAVPQEVHGGTLRIVAMLAGDARDVPPEITQLLHSEAEDGLLSKEGLAAFASRAETVRDNLVRLIHDARARGARVAAYGATAKGAVLLAYCQIGQEAIEYIVDRNPLKQGMLTPGARIPIVSPEHLAGNPPDLLLLLAWNLADEIRAQLAWFPEGGGRFVIPVPEPRLL